MAIVLCFVFVAQSGSDFLTDVKGCLRIMDEIDQMYPSFASGTRLPAQARDLSIEVARYGAQGRFWDVTEAVRANVQDGSLDMAVGNHMFNVGRGEVDPIPGIEKDLIITYELNGERDTTCLP